MISSQYAVIHTISQSITNTHLIWLSVLSIAGMVYNKSSQVVCD